MKAGKWALYFSALKDLFFPAHCLRCGQRLALCQAPFFCDACLREIEYIHTSLCRCCGSPLALGRNHLCELCVRGTFAFDLARTAFVYKMPISQLILSLKFGAQLSAMDTLAALARQSPAVKDLSEPDFVMPVPLHSKRLRKRGFNQAITVARFCFPQWKDKIMPDVLRRARATMSQTSLSGKERRGNLRGAFLLTRPELVEGRHVLLVDDVFTTGSTVNECSKVLRKAGAAGIEVFALARSVVSAG